MLINRTAIAGSILIVIAVFTTAFLESRLQIIDERRPASIDGASAADYELRKNFNKSVQEKLQKSPVVALSDNRITETESFQFGELRGQFKLWIDPQRQGRIWRLENINPDAKDQFRIEQNGELAQILKKNASLFAVDFAQVQMQSTKENESTYALFDSRGKQTGQAFLRTTTQGQILSIELKSL